MSAPETGAAAPAPAQASQTDVQMTDATPAASEVPTISERPTTTLQPFPPPQPTSEATPAQSPAPAKTGTPLRNEVQGSGSGGGTGSRAQSAHPDQSLMPSQAALHGAPVRQYLNSRVTGPLLEGMKKIGKEQPSDPLRVLGEFLIQKSKELEGK
ncbi:hypothetical protein CONLIGDRAFT_676546 [Coniochaeta ligniaria NRRL 30616]|uniref:Uncharacterized protein n=1 Tax=Coniochaeta ligniaria NRRL 30616 TaxID=1408157 RepID=A0A1J7J853_9PEZI|nr:hypothetical protein CONLIGDRAFT_676546 [Coniochaeta ligniaria NRRL 30616]